MVIFDFGKAICVALARRSGKFDGPLNTLNTVICSPDLVRYFAWYYLARNYDSASLIFKITSQNICVTCEVSTAPVDLSLLSARAPADSVMATFEFRILTEAVLKGWIKHHFWLSVASSFPHTHFDIRVLSVPHSMGWTNSIPSYCNGYWGREEMTAILQTTFQMHFIERKCS